ncbi:MBL fold metallo-hydrolase [Haloglomus litoreum]|uniref:MBL fold metallo-hydrolase n=1 Tax=Haloglomus litoreum TaxID=3034026 RepID=UPI0023E84BA3|nr:MBL fold metallo-hydrolase [Haloglomus sp. DT116]
MVRHDGIRADWLGYATLRLETPAPGAAPGIESADSSTVVYCDPGRYGVLSGEWPPDGAAGDPDHHPAGPAIEPRDGDLVCVTHDHHYDPAAIRRVASADATVVVFDGVNTHRIDRDVERPVDLPHEVRRVDDEADIAVGEVVVRTTAAFNHADGPHVDASGDPFHPEGFGCGFHLTLPSPARTGPDATPDGGVRVFWPGDTDVLEGHAELDVSLFCPPIGGSFTMDRHAAAELAAAMDPDLVLPVHYNTFEALRTDSRAFAADVAEAGVPVVLSEAWPADLF